MNELIANITRVQKITGSVVGLVSSNTSKGDHATTEYLSVFDATEIEVYTEDYEVESE